MKKSWMKCQGCWSEWKFPNGFHWTRSISPGVWDHEVGLSGGAHPRSWPETLSIVSLGAGAVSLLCYCSPSLTTSAVTNRNGVVGRWSSSPHGKMWLCSQALWSSQRTVLGWCRPLLHSLLIPYAERTQTTFKHYHYEATGQFGQLTYVLPFCFSWQGRRRSKQRPPHLTHHPHCDHYWRQEHREVPPSPEI